MKAIPSTKVPPKPDTAVLYALKLRLPEGRGLARILIEAGVNQGDAAAVARLAAGHLGDGHSSCETTVEISRSLQDRSFTLQRAVLLTATGQTIIERRSGELTIASVHSPSKTAQLV